MEWLNKYVDKGEKVTFRVVDNETLVIYLDKRPDDKDTVSILNETGTFIWQQLDGRGTVKEILKKVCDEFKVDYKRVQDEIIRFLSNLLKRDLITISNVRRK